MSDEELTELSLMIPCPVCESFAWCVTRSGRQSHTLHARRVEPLRQAYLLGRETALYEVRKAAHAFDGVPL